MEGTLVFMPTPLLSPLIFPSQLKQVERDFIGASLVAPSSLYEEFLQSLKSELTHTYTEEAEKREEEEEERERSTKMSSTLRQPG